MKLFFKGPRGAETNMQNLNTLFKKGGKPKKCCVIFLKVCEENVKGMLIVSNVV